MRFTLLAASLAFVSTSSFAGAPEELDSARASFKEAASAVASAKASITRAGEALHGCHNGVLQLQFSDSVSRLEKARRSLEAGRRDAQAYRAELEGARRSLEVLNRGPSREEYAKKLVTEYAAPLGQQLVPLLKTYSEGIEGWSAIFVKYGAFCAQPGFTTQKGSEFVASTSGEIDALTRRSGELTAAASAARASISSAVAAAPRHVKHHAGRR